MPTWKCTYRYKHTHIYIICCSVTKSCPSLWNKMDCSMPGSSVIHYLPEFAQTYVHCWYLSISSSATSFFWLQSFPTSGSFSELAFCIKWPKYWSFRFNNNPCSEYSVLISFKLTGFISLVSKGHSRVFSRTTIQNHQFFGTQPSLWSNTHIHTRLLEKL